MKNKIIKYVPFVLIILTLASIAGVTCYAFFDKKTVSKSEQRELASIPELSVSSWKDNSFQQGMEAYVGDHVWNRDKFISLGKKVEDYMRLPGKTLILKDITQENTGKNKNEVIALDDRIVPMYSHNDENLVFFYESCSLLFNSIPKGINKYFLIPPGRIEYEEEDIKAMSGSSEYDAAIVYENMDKSVTCVPVHDAVRKGVEENSIDKIFYRTDHHWSQLGAYYAARELLKAADKKVVNLDDYECRQGYDFQGYLTVKYSKEGTIPDDQLYYYMPKDGTECYETVYWNNTETGENEVHENEKVVDYMRGGYYTFVEKTQFSYTVIDGKKNDGSSLLIVTDSFGLALTTWLTEEFDTIVVVDPRYFENADLKFSELFTQYNITDFLLCLQAEEMSVDVFNIKMLDSLLGIQSPKK